MFEKDYHLIYKSKSKPNWLRIKRTLSKVCEARLNKIESAS